MDERNDTGTLKHEQRDREEREAQLARSTEDEHEIAQHERRAERAHYLRKKLEEREASEHE